MKHLIIRTGINCYEYTVSRMMKGLSSDALLTMTVENYQTYAERLKHRPMFSKNFLIQVYYNSDSKYLDYIQSMLGLPWIQCVIYASSKESYEDLQQKIKIPNVVFFDSYRVSDDVLIKYIQQRLWDLSDQKLKVSKDVAKHIRYRIRFKEYELDSKLELLVHTDLSRKTINKLIPKYRGVKLSTLPYHYFRAEKKREVASFLVRYKNNIDTIYKPLVKFLDTWLDVFEYYLTGELSESSILDWIGAHGPDYDTKYEYQARRWLELFSMYSYDKVLAIRLAFEEHSGDTTFRKTLFLTNLLRSLNYEQTGRLLA